MAGWTQLNLRELEDVAPGNGLGERWFEYRAFGPHHEDDGEGVDSDWPDETG